MNTLIYDSKLHAYLCFDRILGNELVDMYSLLLANPVKATRSAFVLNLALSLPVASIDSLTFDTLLPPAKIKDMNKT